MGDKEHIDANTRTVSDIHSYTLFANIDDREGAIKGHMVLLTKEQYEVIENIVLRRTVRVKEEYTYELEEDNE